MHAWNYPRRCPPTGYPDHQAGSHGRFLAQLCVMAKIPLPAATMMPLGTRGDRCPRPRRNPAMSNYQLIDSTGRDVIDSNSIEFLR
jgi:hypothetical protein